MLGIGNLSEWLVPLIVARLVFQAIYILMFPLSSIDYLIRSNASMHVYESRDTARAKGFAVSNFRVDPQHVSTSFLSVHGMEKSNKTWDCPRFQCSRMMSTCPDDRQSLIPRLRGLWRKAGDWLSENPKFTSSIELYMNSQLLTNFF